MTLWTLGTRVKSILGAIALATAALASFNAAAETYAAIAFSQVNGYYGYSNRYGTQDGAEERALQECGESCEIVIWARDACAALFVGDGNGYGVAWAASEQESVQNAAAECDARTANCELKTAVCSAY
jgi:serine/threonine-protein kinase